MKASLRLCVLCGSVFLLAANVIGDQLPDIYWNSSNPIFRIDNTDHVFEARIMDVLTLHCPSYSDQVLSDETERAIIYRVSKYGYDNCVLDEAQPVGQCLDPYQPISMRVVFRQFTPLPDGLEFVPGQPAYFISTSDGTEKGAKRRRGGLCKTRNMRIRFEILKGDRYIRPEKPQVSEEPPTEAVTEESPYASQRLNPRWRSKLRPSRPETTRKPAASSEAPFASNRVDDEYSPFDWWNPQRPSVNIALPPPPQAEKELSKSFYGLPPMADQARQPVDDPFDRLFQQRSEPLFIVTEASEELFYRASSARRVSGGGGWAAIWLAVGLLLALRRWRE